MDVFQGNSTYIWFLSMSGWTVPMFDKIISNCLLSSYFTLLIQRLVLNAPNKVVFIRWNVDKSCMWFSSSAIFYEILTSLHHLNILVFPAMIYIDGKISTNSWQSFLDVLCISFELILANSFINLWELFLRVMRSCIFALIYEEFFCLLEIRINCWVMVQRV